MKEEGYEVERGEKVITVFSAPKYCDQAVNKGAYILFDKDMKPRFNKFEAVVSLSGSSAADGHALREGIKHDVQINMSQSKSLVCQSKSSNALFGGF